MNTTNSALSSTAHSDGGQLTAALGQLVRRPEAGSLLGLVAVFVFFSVLGAPVFLSPRAMRAG
jgi:simple sugar transport system permease protein